MTREAIVNAISAWSRGLSLGGGEGEGRDCTPAAAPKRAAAYRGRGRGARRASPGTLEVNVLRMVGRCLVCSRLISTWVSSLEPPPSTPSPSTPPSPIYHRNRLTLHHRRIRRHRHQEACSCTAQSSCPFHMSHLAALSRLCPSLSAPSLYSAVQRSGSDLSFSCLCKF